MDFEYCKMEIFIPASYFKALRAALRNAMPGT